ncbi:MAG: PAS domain S-box protein, partial [Verrucomicrobia bacterium]|nr:PAS domain S-box protein [Verrucomicrobiota bacterium]
KSNLARLLPAVERELREATARRERIGTKRALLELQERFETIFRELTDVMLILDARDGEVLHANPALERVFGYNERRMTGADFAVLWPEARHNAPARLLKRLKREGSVAMADELRRVDGTPCQVDVSGNLVPWGAGQAAVLTIRDATDRHRAEQRLANEKEQLAVTLRSLGEGVITTDTAGRVLLINRTAERLTGWTQREAEGKALEEVLQLVQCSCDELLAHALERLPLSGESGVEPQHNTLLRARDGKERTVGVTAAPIHRGSQTTGVVLVFRDTTDELRLEEERLKASKLESVGLLAGGIAHDFNNVLMSILGNISLAKARMEKAPATQPDLTGILEKAENACLYATDLTRQLLTFAKGGSPIKQTASLAEIVQEAVQFALHGSHLRASFALPEDLHPVDVDRNQFRQVLDNLVINAIQATVERGQTLDISAANVRVREDEPVVGLKPGEYVRVSIKDTGVGIAPEALSKIFDPYFTTKEQGTGLGLATAYSIIKKHDGLLLAESELGKGSTFHVYLPASVETVPTPEPEPGTTPLGEGRVLLMDDEPLLLELVAEMLEYLGYQVTKAHEGSAALEQFIAARKEGRPFAAVIVDLTVPGGMGGYETVQLMHEIDPHVRAIVSSGYSSDPIMANYRMHGFRGFIAKPYQTDELARVLHKVLSEEQ